MRWSEPDTSRQVVPACGIYARGVTSEPTPLSASIDSVMRSLDGGRNHAGAAAVGGVFGRWVEIVGEAMALHVQPVRLDGERLVLEVSEPAWATQVRLLSDRIGERVGEVAGVTVTAIEVRVATRRRR